MKRLRILIAVAGLVASAAVIAAEEDWHTVNKSITAMLNEGWTIRHYSPRGSYGYEETFLLEKDGKYVRCRAHTSIVSTSRIFPDPHEHVESTCEALN